MVKQTPMINIGLKRSWYLCCQSLYHSLSLTVIRCTTRCHSLSLFVIRCATRLSFYNDLTFTTEKNWRSQTLSEKQFYRFFLFKFSLYEVFHWYFSVCWSLSSLLVIVIIKIVTLYNSRLSTILYFINVEDQLNLKNLEMKLCMRQISPTIFCS